MTEHLQESSVFILANGGERKNPGFPITNVGNDREGKTGMTEGGGKRGGNCQRMNTDLFVYGEAIGTVSGAFGRTGAIVPTW